MKTMKQYSGDTGYQFNHDVITERYENQLANIPATLSTCNGFDERIILAL